MTISLRATARWVLAILIVTIPASYLLWSWRFSDNPVLSAFSYEAFNERLSEAREPAFWTYCPWVILILLVLNVAILLVAKLLERMLTDTRRS